MLDGLASLGQAYLALLLSPMSIVLGLAGALTGILVGCLPGLSATLCIALLATLTVKLNANDATDGSLVPFFTRPICMVLASITIFTMLLYVPWFNRTGRRVLDAVAGAAKISRINLGGPEVR
jgi:TctA family transporter